jgi:hypothetical protein
MYNSRYTEVVICIIVVIQRSLYRGCYTEVVIQRLLYRGCYMYNSRYTEVVIQRLLYRGCYTEAVIQRLLYV